MTRAPSRDTLRLVCIDAYRGLVMLLMLGEILRLAAVAAAWRKAGEAPPLGQGFWDRLAYHQTHVEWVGCSLHDLIQPSFSFLVGVSLPFSLAARAGRGQSQGAVVLHAVWRAVVLVALGTYLRSLGRPIPDFGFTDTLCQIGLGYPFLFLLGFAGPRARWAAVGGLLVGYWALFALWPLPGPDFDWGAVGVSGDWLRDHGLPGFAAHWDKNSNPAAAFDRWFLNQFPREKPFAYSDGGYAVLSFVPTLATMILGLLAGNVLKTGGTPGAKIRWLVVAGLLGLAAGYALGLFGVCPVVKRIWTPSWVLLSGGWCFLLLGGLYAATDAVGRGGWAFPLVVVGANSIAAYCMSSLVKIPWVHKPLGTFFGPELSARVGLGGGPFRLFGPEFEPLLHGAATLVVLWLMLLWMYRRGAFVRI